MFQACACAHFLFNSTNTHPDGANRGSGLRTSCLERRSWPITPPLGMSSLDGQVVRNFKFPQGETIGPSRARTGRKPGGSFSLSIFDTPAPTYPFTRFASSSCTSSQTCFPSFLTTMPYLTHIDVTLHVFLNYPGRHHVVLCSHMFSCVFWNC